MKPTKEPFLDLKYLMIPKVHFKHEGEYLDSGRVDSAHTMCFYQLPLTAHRLSVFRLFEKVLQVRLGQGCFAIQFFFFFLNLSFIGSVQEF